MELIIHPEAARDAREIAAKYAGVSPDLGLGSGANWTRPSTESLQIQNDITMIPAAFAVPIS